MSNKPKKATGSFVSDPSAMNLMQISPRTESFYTERSPFTMANHSSKTNFISESVLSEGPRAVAVTETGEKHTIDLEDDMLKTNTLSNMNMNMNLTLNTNPFANASGQFQETSQATISTPKGCERSRHSSKRSKPSRHLHQKTRPIFTPRQMARMTPRKYSEDEFRKAKITLNAHTQTDLSTPKPSRMYQINTTSHATSHHPAPPPTTTTQSQGQTPVLPPLYSQTQSQPQLPRKFLLETVGDMPDHSRRQPLRLLPRKKAAVMKNYAGSFSSSSDDLQTSTHKRTNFLIELRNIASALTLITVVSWLFSTFFELEGLIEMTTGLVQSLSGWFDQRKQPMTKAELLIQYLREWLF